MRWLLTFMLVFMLALSHGSIGGAAPHHEHSDDHHHAHAPEMAAAAQHDVPRAQSPTRANSDEGSAGHLPHVHVLADLVRAQTAPEAVRATKDAIRMARLAVPVPSHGIAPPLKPPAA